MFTGIVTDIGTVLAVRRQGDLRVEIGTTFDTGALDLGASVACSGVCLTVVERAQGMFAVDVSAETVSLTAADHWREGARLNLERSLRVGDELGGHIVLGHVDGIGRVEAVEPEGGSTRLTIAAPAALAPYLARKGSVAVDGVSLTVNGVKDRADGTGLYAQHHPPYGGGDDTPRAEGGRPSQPGGRPNGPLSAADAGCAGGALFVVVDPFALSLSKRRPSSGTVEKEEGQVFDKLSPYGCGDMAATM